MEKHFLPNSLYSSLGVFFVLWRVCDFRGFLVTGEANVRFCGKRSEVERVAFVQLQGRLGAVTAQLCKPPQQNGGKTEGATAWQKARAWRTRHPRSALRETAQRSAILRECLFERWCEISSQRRKTASRSKGLIARSFLKFFPCSLLPPPPFSRSQCPCKLEIARRLARSLQPCYYHGF